MAQPPAYETNWKRKTDLMQLLAPIGLAWPTNFGPSRQVMALTPFGSLLITEHSHLLAAFSIGILR